MTEEYKSATAGTLAGTVRSHSVNPERENDLLGGGGYSTEAVLKTSEEEAKRMLKMVDRIGVNNTIDVVKYKFLDTIGVSSPEKRREGFLQDLQYSAADLDRRIKAHFESVDKLGEETKRLNGDKRDIREILRGYQAMEAQLISKSGQLESDVAACYGKAKELQPSDPQYRALEQQGADAKEERDLIEADIQIVGYKIERASGAALRAKNQIVYVEHQNQLLRSNLDKLEECKNLIDLKIGELAPYTKRNDLTGVVDTLGGLSEAHSKYTSIAKMFGNIPSQIYKVLGRIATSVKFGSVDSQNVEAQTKELKRNRERRKSELVRAAEEMFRDEMAA
jgi:chromosome segregation ATPase